ncbi:MAG: hypothetical protein VX904_15335, partial [Planctomycetota bacterium]|nr:hypothetical protein [Planctomycetota bacterium]
LSKQSKFTAADRSRDATAHVPTPPPKSADDGSIPRRKGQTVAAVMAERGYQRAKERPWSEILANALERSQQIARLIHPCAPPDSVWADLHA